MNVLFEEWGASPAEVAGGHITDAAITDPQFKATRSITINASREDVFSWLVQMGYGRAGWYSYDWIDNLARPSATTIVEQWQKLEEGDLVPAGPIDFVAEHLERPSALVLTFRARRMQFALGFELSEIQVGRGRAQLATRLSTRVLTRIEGPAGAFIARYPLGIGDGIMVRKQLLGIKSRAEAAS